MVIYHGRIREKITLKKETLQNKDNIYPHLQVGERWSLSGKCSTPSQLRPFARYLEGTWLSLAHLLITKHQPVISNVISRYILRFRDFPIFLFWWWDFSTINPTNFREGSRILRAYSQRDIPGSSNVPSSLADRVRYPGGSCKFGTCKAPNKTGSWCDMDGVFL